MRVVDTAVLAALQATGIDINDGYVDVDAGTNVVSYPLPYAVFHSSIGDDDNRRLGGRKTRRSVFFTVTYVGRNRDQTKWAGEKIRAALHGKRLVVAGHRMGLVDLQESQRIRRDDDAVRPYGSPLFYGVDNYAVPVYSINPVA